MGKTKKHGARPTEETSVYVLEIPGGLSVSGNVVIRVDPGKEKWEDFVNRIDNVSNDLRNAMIRKLAKQLKVDVRFQE